MEWNNYVSGVSDLLKLNVRHLFVADISWVMSWNISRQFWEVGSHFENLFVI